MDLLIDCLHIWIILQILPNTAQIKHFYALSFYIMNFQKKLSL